MFIKTFFNPRKVKIPPKANDKFAKLMEINVKNNAFKFLTYLIKSTKIIVFIKVITKNIKVNLSNDSISKKNITSRLKKKKLVKLVVNLLSQNLFLSNLQNPFQSRVFVIRNLKTLFLYDKHINLDYIKL